MTTKIADSKDYLAQENLCDLNNRTDGYYLDASGNAVSYAPYSYLNYIEVQPNTTYYIYGLFSQDNTRIIGYNSSKGIIGAIFEKSNVTDTYFTTPNDCKYIQVSYAREHSKDDAYIGVNAKSNVELTKEIPHIKGNSVSCVMSYKPIGGSYYGFINSSNDGELSISGVKTFNDNDWGEITITTTNCTIGYVDSMKAYRFTCTDSQVAGKLVDIVLA